MYKNTFLSLIISLFFVENHAQNLNESIPISSEVEIGQLDNGLTTICKTIKNQMTF